MAWPWYWLLPQAVRCCVRFEGLNTHRTTTDCLQTKLRSSSGPAAVAEAAALLAELGGQLREVLPASSIEVAEVAERLDQHLLLQELLTSGGGAISTTALFGLLDWSAGLLARFGAPAREAAAAAAQAAVRQQLAAADGDAAATAAVAVRALRLLALQLKLLRMDTGEPDRSHCGLVGAGCVELVRLTHFAWTCAPHLISLSVLLPLHLMTPLSLRLLCSQRAPGAAVGAALLRGGCCLYLGQV